MTSAVITVPASFGVAPCRATVDAAKLAGIENVLLLQEPVAAAIAYGIQPGVEDENWLVFDLGGGTFDVAVVSTRDLNLTVISHAGDRFLGGKDVDLELVRKVIIPFLEDRFKLPLPVSDEYKALTARLLPRAEEAKIALTYDKSYLLDLYDLGTDLNGKLIEKEITITREDVESCTEELLAKCLQLTKQAVAEARVSPDGISRVLLVGGVTQMPYVRDGVAEALGVKVDYSRDPITAIVEGAAFFGVTKAGDGGRAADVRHDEAVKVLTHVDVMPGDETAIIKGRVMEINSPMEIAFYYKDWDLLSEWVLVDSDGSFEIEVSLDESKKLQVLELKLRHQAGAAVSLADNQVVVNRTIAVGAPRLQHSLWIEVQDQDKRFDELFRKGDTLPAEKTDLKYRVARNITSTSEEEFLPVKIWEGEDVENLDFVEIIEIKKGPGILIQGQTADISISIDESRILEAKVFLPEAKMMAVSNVTIPDDMNVQQRQRLLDTSLSRNYEIIDKIKHLIVPETEVEREFNRLVRQLDNMSIELYHNRDNSEEVDKLTQQERTLGRGLRRLAEDLILGDQKKRGPYDKDKKRALTRLEEIRGKTGDEYMEEEINRLKNEISSDYISERELGQKLRHADQLYTHVINNDISFLKEYFDFAKSRQVDMSNQKAAGKFIAQAEEALRNENVRALHRAVYELYRLLPER